MHAEWPNQKTKQKKHTKQQQQQQKQQRTKNKHIKHGRNVYFVQSINNDVWTPRAIFIVNPTIHLCIYIRTITMNNNKNGRLAFLF